MLSQVEINTITFNVNLLCYLCTCSGVEYKVLLLLCIAIHEGVSFINFLTLWANFCHFNNVFILTSIAQSHCIQDGNQYLDLATCTDIKFPKHWYLTFGRLTWLVNITFHYETSGCVSVPKSMLRIQWVIVLNMHTCINLS